MTVRTPSVRPRADLGATAFYAVSCRRHFIGLVGMLNGLRLAGHDEPLVVLDAGMDPAQVRRLEGHAVVLPAPPARLPHMLKWHAPQALPADVMVAIDADMIPLRRLDPLIGPARRHGLAAVADALEDRCREEWSDLLGLGPLTPRTYVNTGLVAMRRDVGLPLMAELDRLGARVDVSRSVVAGGGRDEPLRYLDQDVFNAVAASRPDLALSVLPREAAPVPPFADVRITCMRAPACAGPRAGLPLVLHHTMAKPWLAVTRPSPYSRLLARVLLWPDVAVRLEAHEVPRRLRPGLLAAADRRHAAVRVRVRAARRRVRDARAAA